jgi:hypothetical protein
VPAQASTPIFEQVVTSWFVEPLGTPVEPISKPIPKPAPKPVPPPPSKPTAAPAAATADWSTPADPARHAAESALNPAEPPSLTDAGLPTRRPGAQLAPGAVVPRVREQDGGTFRDAAAVRTSLSRHYQGMRAARRQTAAGAEEPPEDGVDPR